MTPRKEDTHLELTDRLWDAVQHAIDQGLPPEIIAATLLDTASAVTQVDVVLKRIARRSCLTGC